MTRILVTGASGNVGSAVIRSLTARGAEVVAAHRDPSSAPEILGEAAASVRFDFTDRSSWEGALEGIERLFLVRPPAIANVDETLNPFVDRARALGADHVVFLSVAGAGTNKFVPHRAVEDHLRAEGKAYTNLRPGFVAQNLGAAYRRDIVEDDRIYVPAGRAPVNWIDTRDIGELAALILLDPAAHRGRDYTLTGPGPVPWSQVVGALSDVLGRPIRYEPASVPGYIAHLIGRRLPAGEIAVRTILHVLLRFGQGAGEDPTLERLLGRPPRGIRTYVEDHAELWAKPERGGN